MPGIPASKDVLLNLMYQALEAEIGIRVGVNAPDSIKAKFYQARQAAMDPELHKLSFKLLHFPDRGPEIWIFKRSPNDVSETGRAQSAESNPEPSGG